MNTDVDKLYTLPPPPDTRGFFDPIRTRKWVQEAALSAFQDRLNKLESLTYKLKVKDLHFQDPDKTFTYADQKRAVMGKEDLILPLKGTVQLIDKNTNQVIEEKKLTLAHVPYITDAGTAVLNGSEYLVGTQQRLKPGVYARRRETGEVEAHINVASGSGSSCKLLFEADKALFVLKVGTISIKLYTLLHEMGVDDATLRKAWGEEVFLKNKAAYNLPEVDKLYAKLFRFG